MIRLFILILGGLAVSLPAVANDLSSLAECMNIDILEASNCAGDGWEPEEEQLYELINQYRVQYELPPVPRSASLTLLANRHVLDIAHNIGQLTHSWSDCSYDPGDRNTLSCSSWSPQRLGTRYPGRAYENAHYNSRGATAISALRGWQTSPPHNALVLNLSNWHNNRWRAMGIGIYKQYAVLWVGEERDPETNSIASIDPANRRSVAEIQQESRPRRGFRLPSVRIRIR